MFRNCVIGAMLFAAVIFTTAPAPANVQQGMTGRRIPTKLMVLRISRDPSLRAILIPWLARGQRFPSSVAVINNPSAWTDNVLYTFGGPDGAGPNALVAAGGALYGTTFGGGAFGNGTVFKLTPPGNGQAVWSETVLYSFAGNALAGSFDGANPAAGLFVDASGALYGTTTAGGNSGCFGSGCGTAFKLTPPGVGKTQWTESILHAFTDGADGSMPYSNLIAVNGALYGTTLAGGSLGGGTAFALLPPAVGQTVWTESVLHAFGAPGDGKFPQAGFILARGALYSTTSDGGKSPYGGHGTVFRLVPPTAQAGTWTETIVHTFTGFDGADPLFGLIGDRNGALYGTTTVGGYGGCNPSCGTAFKLTPPATTGQTAWTHTVLHYFTAAEGNEPGTGLIGDKDGNLYGMTTVGGAYDNGNVYKLTAPASGKRTWKQTVLHTFTGGSDGGFPYSENLIRDVKGALYGATELSAADACQCGVVFKLTP